MIDNIEKLFKTELPPVLIIFGAEEFLIDNAYEKIKDHVLKNSINEYDNDNFDGDSASIDKIVDSCRSYPFVSEKRFVIVRNFDKLFSGKTSKKSKDSSPFVKYIENPQPTTFLLIISQFDKLNGLSKQYESEKDTKFNKTISKLSSPYSYILQKAEWIEFPKLNEKSYGRWVSNRLKTLGKEIDPEALELLVSHSTSSLRILNNEIIKLVDFTYDKNRIDIDDVTNIVGISKTNNVFQLQKAIGRRDLGNAILIVKNMLENERQEMLILTMLTRYFHTLWLVSDLYNTTKDTSKIASSVGVSPYFIKEYIEAAKIYKPDELDEAIILLTETDESLKSTSTDSTYMIQRMLINIIDGK